MGEGDVSEGRERGSMMFPPFDHSSARTGKETEGQS